MFPCSDGGGAPGREKFALTRPGKTRRELCRCGMRQESVKKVKGLVNTLAAGPGNGKIKRRGESEIHLARKR
jgi:hypothetical protein